MQNANQIDVQKPAFQVDGEIVYSTHDHSRSGRELFKQVKNFVVSRKGLQWNIRTVNNNRDDQFSDSEWFDEAGCDGTHMRELKQFDGAKIPKTSNGQDVLTPLGRVWLGTMPAGLDPNMIFPLWLAYCSSPYFSALKDNLVMAPLFAERNFIGEPLPARLCRPAAWNLNSSAFPSEINWFGGDECAPAEASDSGGTEFAPRPPDRRFAEAGFEVTDWLSFSGTLLPGRFTLKQFVPRLLAVDKTNPEICYMFEAHVKAVRGLGEFNCAPSLTVETLITDHRFTTAGCGLLQYCSASGWQRAEEVEAKLKTRGVTYEKQEA